MFHVQYPFSVSFLDYPNPVDHAVIVYFLGCNHACEGCQNPEFRSFLFKKEGFKEFDMFEFGKELRKELEAQKTNKVVFSGGDPLVYHFNHIKDLLNIFNFKACIYTGYDFSVMTPLEIKSFKKLKGFEFIKMGNYREDLKVLPEKTNEYIQFASTNQQLYDKDWNLVSKDGRYYFTKEQ